MPAFSKSIMSSTRVPTVFIANMVPPMGLATSRAGDNRRNARVHRFRIASLSGIYRIDHPQVRRAGSVASLQSEPIGPIESSSDANMAMRINKSGGYRCAFQINCTGRNICKLRHGAHLIQYARVLHLDKPSATGAPSSCADTRESET